MVSIQVEFMFMGVMLVLFNGIIQRTSELIQKAFTLYLFDERILFSESKFLSCVVGCDEIREHEAISQCLVSVR